MDTTIALFLQNFIQTRFKEGRYVPVARAQRRTDQAGRRDPAQSVGRFLKCGNAARILRSRIRICGAKPAKSRSDFGATRHT